MIVQLPIQVRGPPPNGMNAYRGRPTERSAGKTLWIEALGIRPQAGVAVDRPGTDPATPRGMR